MRLMFMDEARFGRMNRPVRCWAPPGVRPVDGCQVIRQYTDAYTAVSPSDGQTCSLILPSMEKQCFQAFLDTLAGRFEGDLVCLITDGAGSHITHELDVPDNVELITLPPYSPELHPVEQIWALLRKHWFDNQIMRSMDAVETVLTKALTWLTDIPERLKILTRRAWATTPSP
ncbi:IS630 family transposase [Patulibacter sp. NPDC049589]|uniref:IS630 family transposase n=1 Tax=Patulibacter sp. NPDC049589 TaxID=3154731 RepID=UPI003446BC04